ncbi:disulfide-isomerase 5-1-like protein [Drosera capensis]
MAPSNRFLRILTSSLFLFSILIASSSAEVITLTSDTFSDKIKEKDTAWFVRFCVPWCKHWAMEGEDDVEIGQVDCSLDKPACTKADIHSYPTFKLFYNGEEVARYQGSRDVESLKAFAVEETAKAAAKVEAEVDDDRDL